jgi:invasion protein IalB
MTNAVLRIGGAMALAALVSAAPALAQENAAPATKPAATKPATAKPAAAPAKPAAASTKTAAPAKAAAPKAGATVGGPEAAAAADGNKSAWVKLCERAPLVKKDAEGKEVKEEKNLCLTHHERLDGNTGMVLVSAAIREVEGQDKKSLMVMVPLGMAIPPGIRAAVYTKDQWGAVSKKLKPVELKFSLCHPAGCTAETEATAEIIEQMKSGGGMMVVAMNANAQPIGFPVPLDGFADAYAGAPIDNKAYADARSQLMKQIRDRQTQLAEQYRKDQQEKSAAMRNLPGVNTTGGEGAPATTGSTAKPAPAEKK